MLGGPAAAVGGYFIGKAVEQGVKNSPNAQAAIKEAGLLGVDLLSSSSPTRNREEAEANGYEESQNLLVAAGTLLNIGTLKKFVGKATELVGGIGKPKAGQILDTPDTPPPPSKFTILEQRDHHDAQARIAAEEFRALGYSIPDDLKQLTFGGSCLADGRCRTDFGGFDVHGKAVVFEVKTGDASLSIRQSDIYPQIKDGNAIPYGEVAWKFGLDPGVPLKDQGYPNGIPVIEIRKPGLGQ